MSRLKADEPIMENLLEDGSRTHLQDAVPLESSEIGAYASGIRLAVH